MHQLTKEESRKKQIKSITKSIIIVIVCSAFISITVALFLNPAGLYAGGVTGIAQVIIHTMGLLSESGDLNKYQNLLGIFNFALLLPFNILAWFKLSKKYAIYTAISSVVQTIVFSFTEKISELNIFLNSDGRYDILACAILGAIFGGVCNGFMMKRGATSGGIIIYCQYVNIKKGKSVGSINFIACAVILVLSAIISFFDNSHNIGSGISTAFYTLISFLVQSLAMDYIHTSYNKVKLEIVTEKGNDIINELLEEFPHGITIETGIGAYSKREKSVLNVIVQKYESDYYVSLIRKIDINAFITVLPCERIFGKFTTKVIDK